MAEAKRKRYGAKASGAYQTALYDAQDAGLYRDGWGRCFANTAEARAYADGLVGSDWFTFRWPEVSFIEIERKGRSARWSSVDDDGVIWLASLNKIVLLHEVAHVICDSTCNGVEVGHNPAYARVLLALIRHEVGFQAYGSFLSALRATEAFRHSDLSIDDLQDA